MSMQKRVFISEIKSIDEKEFTMTAAISTDTIDRSREVLDPEGVDLTNYKKNPVVLWAHDYSKLPIGKALWVKRDGKTILSKMKFASTDFAQEVFQLYKEGILKAFSVGFIPKQTEYAKYDPDEDQEKSKKKPRATYKKWELLEYSAVPVPANPDAIALAVQKGFLKSDTLKKAMEDFDESEEKEQPLQEFDNEEKQSPEVIEETNKEEDPIQKKEDGLGELLAENEQLKQQLEAKEKETSDLKYRVFSLLQEKQKKSLEITDAEILRKAEEIFTGVIRRYTGKVN